MDIRKHLLGLAVLAALGAAPEVASAQVPFAHLERATAEEGEPAPESVEVEVRNRNYLDATVYAWNGAQRVRLGTVTGLSTQSLRIPAHLVRGVSSLQFEIDPIGSRARPWTDEVTVGRGDEVVLTIPPLGL